ncbi:MAG: recombinase family protein [Clostridia bacterium]|nr:recombinase family protein [Clostridia bacterium]
MLETIKTVIYKVAIYIRLSKEDVDKGYDESESITNQKSLLTEYVEKLGREYELVDIYIDPGYTGTNFNRPDFQRMIRDIENGKVNMVITKDLSRLGRDYIETGGYIEKWFPEHEVRYVSVTDGIDTFSTNNGNNDIAPFKSILNDMYSKDLSKKIRTALHTMQKQGKWVGGKTAIGYMKDQNDKNKLIICEQEADIVKTIFNMAVLRK